MILAAKKNVVYCLLALPLVASASGCGQSGTPKYPVSGNVSLNGTPLAKGTVFLIDPDGILDSDVGTIVDGTFKFDAKAGKKRVELRAPKETNQRSHFGVAITEEGLPVRYNSDSKLAVEVSTNAKDNNYEFALEAK